MTLKLAGENRATRRKRKSAKVNINLGVLRQAQHHLGNFLTFITSMSKKAVDQAEGEDAKRSARQGFMQLFGEVVVSMSAIDEAINPNAAAGMGKALDDLKKSPEYLAIQDQIQADLRAMASNFTGGIECESIMHPGERCFEVKLTAPCNSFGGWLISHVCAIDEKKYAVIGVEYKPLKPPFKAGDTVRLVVRDVAEDGTVAEAPVTAKGESDDTERGNAEQQAHTSEATEDAPQSSAAQ